MGVIRCGVIMLLLTSLLIITSGCNYKEIDKRFFVVGIGIDNPEDPDKKFKVTLKLAIPNPEPKQGGSSFIILTEEDSSIAEAVGKIKSKVDKELDFGHLKLIILGEDYEGGDFLTTLDWCVRRRDIQQIANVAIGRPTAKQLLEKKLAYETLPSNSLLIALDGSAVESNYITSVYLFELYRNIKELGIDPILPIIEVKENYFTINQVALLEKDGQLKIKTLLSPEETRIFNLIDKAKAKTSIHVNSKELGCDFVINVEDAKKSYKITTTDEGDLLLSFDLKISGIMEESLIEDGGTHLQKCDQQASEFIKNDVVLLLEKMQKERLDPLGFGLYYRSRHWNNEKEWSDWQELYEVLRFEVTVDVNIKSPGVIE